jgi:hypothetical protein
MAGISKTFDDVTHEGSNTFTGTVDMSAATITLPDAPEQVIATAAVIALETATELTIASGAVTVTQGHHTVDTESDAASDDLDTVSGGSVGDVLFVRPASGARTVVLKHATGAGKIVCPGAQDISLAEATDWAVLAHDGTQWVVVAFATLASGGGGIGALLASTASSKGASLVGVQDSASLLSASNVETAIAELAKYACIELADPGTGQAIPVTRSATVPLVVEATGETNTLAVPAFIGQRMILFAQTLGASDTRIVTVAAPVNVANDNTLTFDAESECIELVAAKATGGTLVWQVASNDGVGLSTV